MDFNDLNNFLNENFGSGLNKGYMKRMQNLINNLNNFEGDENPFEGDLGEPTKVVRFEENGYTFEKRVWELESGSIIKIEIVGTPYDKAFASKKELTLEDKLKLAIEEERYEDAAEINKQIKKEKSKPKEESKEDLNKKLKEAIDNMNWDVAEKIINKLKDK